jgi:hypothetical protein
MANAYEIKLKVKDAAVSINSKIIVPIYSSVPQFCFHIPTMYSTAEKIILLEVYFRSGSYSEAKKALASRYPQAPQPSNSTIMRLIDKFRITGSVTKRKDLPRETYSLTEENIAEIQGNIMEKGLALKFFAVKD